jgi:hypothetical protein
MVLCLLNRVAQEKLPQALANLAVGKTLLHKET